MRAASQQQQDIMTNLIIIMSSLSLSPSTISPEMPYLLSAVNCPITIGIVPVTRLLANHSSDRFVKTPIAVGMVPVSVLRETR